MLLCDSSQVGGTGKCQYVNLITLFYENKIRIFFAVKKSYQNAKKKSTGEEQIPNCEICGSKRVFEFQIMPQLLSVLKLDTSLNEKSVDWGVLAVYTCENSCSSNENGARVYKSEFIWKQDI